MKKNDRTLKELATPDVVYQPWCIQYPARTSLDIQIEIWRRSRQALEGIPCGLFHNEATRDTGRLHQNEGQKIGCIYSRFFSTPRETKSECSWRNSFPASRTVTIKKEIYGIRQHSGETLHEYWERFNKLCATCPHHQINEQLLIQYFCEGLMMMDQSMIDATSGGALMDKMAATTRHLISNMESNTQQFGIRGTSQPQMVNEISAIDNLKLENQLTKLTSFVRQLVVGQHQPSIASRVCWHMYFRGAPY
ncbi:hypothetical protein CR513_52153, partial [Mucuna pruriens]